jgi:hypothetical protein
MPEAAYRYYGIEPCTAETQGSYVVTEYVVFFANKRWRSKVENFSNFIEKFVKSWIQFSIYRS